MKGSLHTRRDHGRGGFSADGPAHRAPRQPRASSWTCRPTTACCLVTDAAINIEPTLQRKGRHRAERDRPGAHLGVEMPKVAILVRGRDGEPGRSARRSTPRRCARWPTAARSAARVLDGPLAFDNAISRSLPRAPRASSHRVAGPRRHPAGAEHRSRQYARQAAAVLRRRRQRRYRARRDACR